MQITITIDCDNAAFDEIGIETHAISIIETQAIPSISAGESQRYLYDINGNRVGEMRTSNHRITGKPFIR